MIVHPARHIFEAKFPSLEDHEEEIFYQHPVHDIKCNQLGVLYCDDTIFGIYDKRGTSMVRITKTSRSIGTKYKVIYECYTGKIVNSPHFFFANGNPMDTRKENLVMSGPLSGKQREPYLRIKNRFIKASVEHLIKIENRMEAVGVSKDQVYEILLLPHWLTGARERYVAPTTKSLIRNSTRTSKGTPKPRTTEEEADEIERLFHMGLTFYAIIDRFGWSSTSRVKKIVQDRKLVR
jgi:hypothetical protein